MPITRVRYLQVHLAENLDDQANSAQILNAIPSSITQEDYQRFYLSRMRQIIFGNTAGVHHWYDDFLGQGILSLRDLSTAAGAVRTGVLVAGVQNSFNRTYHTPDYFVHDPVGTGKDIVVYHNGHRLFMAPSLDPSQGDFTVSESGGPGTGFNTIILLTFAPSARSTLFVDYQIALL